MPAKALVTRDIAEALDISERHARRVVDAELKVDASQRAVHRQYNPASLPPDAQVNWMRRDNVIPLGLRGGESAPGQMALALTVSNGPNLSEEDRLAVEKRYKVIEPLIKPEAFPAIWAQNANSRVNVMDWLAKQHKTKRRTIYNWLTSWKQGGLPALVPKDRSDKGQPKILNPAALEFLVAASIPKHGQYGKLSVRDIFRAYNEEREWRAKNATTKLSLSDRDKYTRYATTDGYLAPSAQLPAASYGTFRAWFNRTPEIVRVMGREGDEAFHNTQEIISFRNLTEIQPLDYVVMDHRRLDFFCLVQKREGWSLARPWLTAAIDMRTRKWLAWAIVETPSSDSIATVLKRSFIAHGLPVAVYWDNGKDFRCEWLEGGKQRTENRKVDQIETGFRGVLDTLGIRVHHAIVRRARSKIIEPNFGRTADFDRTLPWWCGHNPTARPAERFDKLLHQHERWLASSETGANVDPAFPTIERVAEFYGNCLNELNERPMQGAEGMSKITPTGKGWMCPNEAWEKLIAKVARRDVPEEVLHICFAKRRDLTIRNGEVRTTFGGKTWHYRMAANPMRLMAMNGCEVQLAYDPLDLQTAALYHENRLVGLVECIELRRMGEDAFVEDEKARRVGRREVKRFIQNVHKNVHVPGHDERSARRAIEPRTDPARALVAASLPDSIGETAAALVADRAPAPAIEVEHVTHAEVTGDEFSFFK